MTKTAPLNNGYFNPLSEKTIIYQPAIISSDFLLGNSILVKFANSVLTLMNEVFGQKNPSNLHNVLECFNELALSHIVSFIHDSTVS